MPELERSKPLHEQIRDHYAREIAEGRLRHGDRMPSSREIAAEWDVAIPTADRALAKLATDGLVERSRRGTFVKAGRLKIGPQQRLMLSAMPASETIEVTAAEYINAPAYVRPILSMEPVREDGLCPVIRREQVHYEPDGTPFMLAVEWIPGRFAEAAPELLDAEPLGEPGGAVRLIEARTGIRIIRGRQGREARLIKDDGREGPMLRLDPGTAVLAEVWEWYDDTDCVEYGEYVLIQNRVTENEFAVTAPGMTAAAGMREETT